MELFWYTICLFEYISKEFEITFFFVKAKILNQNIAESGSEIDLLKAENYEWIQKSSVFYFIFSKLTINRLNGKIAITAITVTFDLRIAVTKLYWQTSGLIQN